jgi:hypothetical protein
MMHSETGARVDCNRFVVCPSGIDMRNGRPTAQSWDISLRVA